MSYSKCPGSSSIVWHRARDAPLTNSQYALMRLYSQLMWVDSAQVVGSKDNWGQKERMPLSGVAKGGHEASQSSSSSGTISTIWRHCRRGLRSGTWQSWSWLWLTSRTTKWSHIESLLDISMYMKKERNGHCIPTSTPVASLASSG